MKTIQTLALACLTFSPAILAQEAEPVSGRVSVEFAGGGMDRFLQLVRDQGEGINILASEMAKDVKLPPLKLRGADVFSALQSVGSVAPEPYQVSVNVMAKGGTPVYSVSVRIRQNPMQPQAMVQPQQLRVFSLRGLTQAPKDMPTSHTMDVNTVLTAIDTGLSVSEDTAATIRYHQDSHLVFVRGTMYQVQLVDALLNQLNNDVQQHRAAEMRVRAQGRRGNTRTSNAAGK